MTPLIEITVNKTLLKSKSKHRPIVSATMVSGVWKRTREVRDEINMEKCFPWKKSSKNPALE